MWGGHEKIPALALAVECRFALALAGAGFEVLFCIPVSFPTFELPSTSGQKALVASKTVTIDPFASLDESHLDEQSEIDIRL